MDNIQSTSTPSGKEETDKSVLISLPTPHTFDLGSLLVQDPNPLPPSPSPAPITSVARTCAQSLLNQLLTTCPIHTSHSNSADAGALLMTLPPPTTPLPREKPLPKVRAKTTWEAFAERKGIKGKKREGGKMEFDEERGEWVPKWGYKGKAGGGAGEEEWIVEVDEKKKTGKGNGSSAGGGGGGGANGKGEEGKVGGERRLGEDRRERKENRRRNERKMRANERRSRKSGGGS